MSYFIYILIIIINLYVSFFHKFKRINREEEYFEITDITERKQLYKYLKLSNILLIIINCIHYLLFFVYKLKISILEYIFFAIHVITYLLLLKSKNYLKIKKEKKEYNVNNKKFIMSILIYFSLICMQRVGDITNLNISFIIYILVFLIIIVLFIFLIKYLIDNRKIVCFSPDEENDYLIDIKFNKKICINSFYNYFIFIFAYILFVYINLPFVWLGYCLTGIMLLYIIFNKSKKFKTQTDKLNKNIYILKRFPGVTYAFQFYKDILVTKKLLLILVFFVLSIISFYLIGNTAFTYLSIELYILLIYITLDDKKKLIDNIHSLNEEFINKEIYKIEKEIPISCIDKIKIFNSYFYKIIYKDSNNIYKSNLILYDPENMVNQIKIYINPHNNCNDYIMIIKELYDNSN